MPIWPFQSDVTKFYGPLRLIQDQLVSIPFPYPVYYGAVRSHSCRIHPKCADSLVRVFDAILAEYMKLHGNIEAVTRAMLIDGTACYDGTYAFRKMRGGTCYSMHAYGCAIDFDAARNSMGRAGRFTSDSIIVRAFAAENWTWGGAWCGKSCDPMHFQATKP